jgi:hypothetical protein
MPGLSRRDMLAGVGAALAGMGLGRIALAAPRLALQGYDPVAYFTLGVPTRGLPEFEYEWDEARYRFARAEHRELFKADPVRYAPQFAGVCAASLARGEIADVHPEYWLVADGKLYLFGKPIGPDLFKNDLADNVAKASQHQRLIVNR